MSSGRLRLGKLLGLVAPAAIVVLVISSGFFLTNALQTINDKADVAHAALGVRTELGALAAIENGAESGEPFLEAELGRAVRDLEANAEIVAAELAPADAAQFEEALDEYATAMIATTRAYMAGDDEVAEAMEAETTGPLYAQLNEELLAIESQSLAQREVTERDTKRGLLIAGGVALVATLILLALEAHRRKRLYLRNALYEANNRYRSLIEDSPDHVYVLDEDGISFMSPAAERHVGRALTDVQDLIDLVEPEYRDVISEFFAAGDFEAHVIVAIRLHGRREWYEVRFSDQSRNPNVNGVVLTARNVTERVELEGLLKRQATEDELTGLPNRRALHGACTDAIARAGRADRAVGVMLIDLDGFKGVNDTLGHPVGDELLQQVARRLSANTRRGELVGRLGGDEFAVLVEMIDGAADAEAAARRLLAAINVPFEVAGQLLAINASIGIAVGGEDTGVDELFRYADIALYESKHNGRGRWTTFHREMEEMLQVQNRLLREMAPGFERGEFSLVYQPLVSIADGTTMGFEALMRWTSPQLGEVPPKTFIPAAERSGLILELGRWALIESCRNLAAWRRQLGDEALTVSVNASVVQLLDDVFPRHVREALELSGLEPEALQIEVTESVLADDEEQVVRSLDAVRSLGVSIALDDFGTGYSSMSQLQALPVDCLKIDRAFIDAMRGGDARGVSVVHALIDLGRALGLRVVAEGVEDLTQLEALRAPKCDMAQGFYLAHPMTNLAVYRWLGERLAPGVDPTVGATGGEDHTAH